MCVCSHCRMIVVQFSHVVFGGKYTTVNEHMLRPKNVKDSRDLASWEMYI